MPIFDYQCEACGHAFDALQKAGEGPLRKCPECGKLKLKKQLAAPNFHLKGSGWYKTDFKDKSAQKDGAKKGHTLDSGPAHSHDSGGDSKESGSKDSSSKESGKDSGHGHSHSHSHGGHTHSHGPGGHKH